MTTVQEKIARRKLSLLQLAQQLRNVSKACRSRHGLMTKHERLVRLE